MDNSKKVNLVDFYLIEGTNQLFTDNLPIANCSNCSFYNKAQKALYVFGKHEYTLECGKCKSPLSDCILHGFKYHSNSKINNHV